MTIKLRRLMFVGGVAMVAAAFPVLAQQMQQPSTGDHSAHHGETGQTSPGGEAGSTMMGQGMQDMGGGQQGMMGSGMQGGMAGCPMMKGMMGSGMQGGMMGQGGPGMMNQGMMGSSPMMGGMMGSGMQGSMGQGMMGCPWCGPGMMGSGYATPQPSINLSANDVKSFLDRWVAGNPNIKIANVSEKDARTITADILTKDKDGLVQRYTFDRQSGFYRAMQ